MKTFVTAFFSIVVAFCLSSVSGAVEEPAAPNWASLQGFAGTITAPQLESLLQKVYVPSGSWRNWITIHPRVAIIEPYPGAPSANKIPLALAASPALCKAYPRYWRLPSEVSSTEEKPLAGLRIVIDPGHLGGRWAKMEERWYRIKKTRPVEEGTMTLIVAKLLKKQLQALGATVYLTRNSNNPATPLRPQQFYKPAKMLLQEEGRASTPHAIKKMAEKLFYRSAEIYYRAEKINHSICPDLVICLHMNAEEWGDEKNPTLTKKNHLHFLISGNFTSEELQDPADRYEMLRKLLGRVHQEEVGIASAVTRTFVQETGLQPFMYHNTRQAREAAPPNPYIWNRNLLAPRIFEAPVLYCEPYVMNSRQVFDRIQMGDYAGKRQVGEQQLPSIYREYANAVAQGVRNYFLAQKKTKN